jgi:hypothetical protein
MSITDGVSASQVDVATLSSKKKGVLIIKGFIWLFRLVLYGFSNFEAR